MIPSFPPSLLHQLSQQQQAQRNAMAQQALGGLGQSGGLSGGYGGGRGASPYNGGYVPEPVNRNITFKEELQDEIDHWLKDI